jgi:hypothetical protein
LPRGTWSAVALTFAAGVPLAVLISTLLGTVLRRPSQSATPDEAEGRLNLWALPAGYLMLLWLANLVAIKVVNSTALFIVATIGVVAGSLAFWLIREASIAESARATEGNSFHETAVVAPLAVLVLLGAFMTAYQLSQGFGTGMVMLGAWPAAGLALVMGRGHSTTAGLPTGDRPLMALPLMRWLFCGVVLVLFRLFSERFGASSRSLEMADNYAFFSVVVGIFLPALLTRILWRSGEAGEATSDKSGLQLARWVMVALIGFAALAIVLILWGIKIALPFFFGLGLCCVLGTSNLPTARTLSGTALLALGLALALVQWANRTLPLADLSRTERVRALAYISVALLLLIVMLDLGGRLLQRLHRRQAAAS